MSSGKLLDEHPIQGGVEKFLVASCYSDQDKLQSDGPFGLSLHVDLTFS